MRFFNWAKYFEETPTCEDILGRVHKTEIYYWIFVSIGVILVFIGFSNICAANGNKQIAMGLFTSIVGVSQIFYVKLWAHARLIMYFLIWDSKNRMDAEIRKSEAADI